MIFVTSHYSPTLEEKLDKHQILVNKQQILVDKIIKEFNKKKYIKENQEYNV